jgi:hypothetical protein
MAVESDMKTPSKLRRTLQAVVIAGASSFPLAQAHAADADEVTAHNYVRAESDFQMKGYVESFKSFGKFHHSRKPYDVDNQITIRGNRDTLYSFGVWDLTSPVTITLPDPKGRYQSLMIVSQDHSISVVYGPKKVTLTEESVGTRYALLTVRTFADPDDEQDMKAAINLITSTLTDTSKMFGKKEELDPAYWMFGAALGWGGLPAAAATYVNVTPEENDGKTPYTLTAKDVPVDAFWSVTLYDDKGWIPVNKYNAYSFNNVTAKKAKDGSVTIRFGGDPKQQNFLPIVPGWNYIVRLYRPKKEILDGSWTFPDARPAQ